MFASSAAVACCGMRCCAATSTSIRSTRERCGRSSSPKRARAIAQYGLRVLADDLHHFPDYAAVYLYRAKLAPKAVAALRSLEGRVDEVHMIAMNARAKLQGVPEAIVARDAIAALLGIRGEVHV